MIVSKEEAENFDWWDKFLRARMITIQSGLALGHSDERIIAQVSCDKEHVERLLITAKRNQGVTT